MPPKWPGGGPIPLPSSGTGCRPDLPIKVRRPVRGENCIGGGRGPTLWGEAGGRGKNWALHQVFSTCGIIFNLEYLMEASEQAADTRPLGEAQQAQAAGRRRVKNYSKISYEVRPSFTT